MVSMFALSVVDRGFISGVMVRLYVYTTAEPTIYHTQGEHANHYTTDEPMIYHTQGEHANHYTTDEPTIYHTQDEHANP
jgi:hypothetical protein